MDSWKGYNAGTMSWSGITKTDEYKERVSYDGNGNILKYLRNGNAGQLPMDSLNYAYNRNGNGQLNNNRLRHVKDAISDGNYAEDIDNQSDDNYEYDAIGNLIKDTKEGITSIDWTVYGKIKKITKSNGTTIIYTYDVAGNRISKAVTSGETTTTTWYTRDAQGNTLAIYTGTASALALSEQHIYGSSRLGVWNRSINMTSGAGSNNYIFARGNKFFELSNHLGNVLVTVSDKKFGHVAGDGTIDYYTSDVVTANDYYPFGMGMPGRKFSAESAYRYGFNGKERDQDMNSLAAYDYGFRIYNPAIGKFLSVDPLTRSYPYYTPYQFAGNKPIAAIDLDGLEEKIVTTQFYSNSKLNNSVTNKSPNPDGTTRSVNASNDKEVVAHALILQAQKDNPNYQIPTNGQFVFWEYPETPEKNSASYYVRVDGNLETFTVSPQILKLWNDELPNARKNMAVAGSLVNLAAAGTALKATLKEASGELKPVQLNGSGPVSGVLEVSANVKSVNALKSYKPSAPIEFVYDPTNKKFLVGQPNQKTPDCLVINS